MRRGGGLRRRATAGFTLYETVLFIALGSLAVAAILGVMVVQQREYGRQREQVRTRSTARTAAMHLAATLRAASASGGDLVGIGPNGFTVRAPTGTAVICGMDDKAAMPTYTVIPLAGALLNEAPDSALAHAANARTPLDDEWRVFKIRQILSPTSGSDFSCDWDVVTKSQTRLEVSGDTTGVHVGCPIVAFRRVEYGLFSFEGGTWLGRKVGGATDWEPLAGPLAPAAAGGLSLSYYNAAGASTTVPAHVKAVDIGIVALRATTRTYRTRDTVEVRAYLRG